MATSTIELNNIFSVPVNGQSTAIPANSGKDFSISYSSVVPSNATVLYVGC
jgi:hypothetical protein